MTAAVASNGGPEGAGVAGPSGDGGVPRTMSDALSSDSPRDALLALANSSGALALSLSADLASSAGKRSGAAGSGGGGGKDAASAGAVGTKRNSSVASAGGTTNGTATTTTTRLPPLPPSLIACAPPASSSSSSSAKQVSIAPDPHHRQNPLETATTAAESIHSSLSKIASGGSSASAEVRNLESERRSVDAEADDIAAALQLRQCATRGAEALSAQRYGEAAEAVRDYRSVKPTPRALDIAGDYAVAGYKRTRDVLQRSVLDRYEKAVTDGDLAGLSELTPLLGMLQLADRGVGLYLRYSKYALAKVMDDDDSGGSGAEVKLEGEVVGEDGRQTSRAALRREKAKRAAAPKPPCHSRLATVYNSAVVHLRHHLPMVAYALGEADGDAALVQLVHLEAERRAVSALREYAIEKALMEMERRAERVAALIEDRYASGGMGEGGGDEGGLTGGLGGLLGLEDGGAKAARRDEYDCGFVQEVGTLPDVDAAMDEFALCLQHTESYERFIRHAVEEVLRAREMRIDNKRKEKMVQREQENAKRAAEGLDLLPEDESDEDREEDKPLEILPPHTQLNEVTAEVGGYYSGLERSLLLASMQRAFLNASYPDARNYSPLGILTNPNRAPGSAGYRALQTSLVEECLYAAQRSTLRAFATGHTGTASAAANHCCDALGRVLLEVLARRADIGASLLRPGEGLLPGNNGLFGQAAAGIMQGAASVAARRKGAGGTPSGGKASGPAVAPGEDEALMRRRIETGIARACANLNDLEVAVDYTSRLEAKFLSEVEGSYPRTHETEQLRACVKNLSAVKDSFKNASDRSLDGLISTIGTRVRSIVNDAVGSDNAAVSSTAAFMGTTVMAGVGGGMGKKVGQGMGVGVGGGKTGVRMNYDLDDEAFELAQVSEGYMSRMCSSLDELAGPLRTHLAPRLADALMIGVLGGASKRIEAAIRRSQFTALGALSLDSDIRQFLNFAKERLDSPDLSGSNVAILKACAPLARLSQIALLMNVDDLEDVLDLISSSKRKGNWDLKLEDAKALLNLRVDFEGRKVNELLRISEGEE